MTSTRISIATSTGVATRAGAQLAVVLAGTGNAIATRTGATSIAPGTGEFFWYY